MAAALRTEEPGDLRAVGIDDLDDLRVFLGEADLTVHGIDSETVRLWIERAADGRIVGSAGFELSSDGAHALIRSVEVADGRRTRGVGTRLARFALDEAARSGAARAWLFSRRPGPFWQRLGFVAADRDELAAALPNAQQVQRFSETGQLEHEVAWSRPLGDEYGRLTAIAVEATADLEERTGRPWRLGGQVTGGRQGGVWELTPGSQESAVPAAPVVLKVASDPAWSSQVVRAAAAVRTVLRAGYPTPSWVHVGSTSAGLGYQVQERVDGRPVSDVTASEATELIRVIESQRGLDPDPDRCWSDFVVDQLTDRAGDLTAAAEWIGPAGNDLVRRCRLLAAECETVPWPRDDMVHGDFRPANVLFRDGGVQAVVDIEAIGSGTRAVDYATLLSHESVAPDAVTMLVGAGVRAAGSAVFGACVAFAFLDLVRFSVGRAPDRRDDVDRTVALLSDRAAVVMATIARAEGAGLPHRG